METASSVAGACSGVTVHACMAAEDLLSPAAATSEPTPQRTDDALGTRNFATAVTGDTQNQILPGALLPRADDKRAPWLIDAVNRAAWSGSSRGGGATPVGAKTPTSRQMVSACATPPEPGYFHPHQPGQMEDVRDKAEKRREAPGSEVSLGEHGRASSMLSITSDMDGAPRASKSPRRVGQPDTLSVISGAASKLSLATVGQSSSGAGSSWHVVEAPPGGLAMLGSAMAGTDTNVGVSHDTQIATFNLASGGVLRPIPSTTEHPEEPKG